MTLDTAVRLSEMLLGLGITLHSLEHCVASRPQWERLVFAGRAALAVGLLVGAPPLPTEGLLVLTTLVALRHFGGPYNGGSDRMALLLLLGLLGSHATTTARWQEIAIGYVAVQVVLSYAIAGWAKLANPDWRNGQAMLDLVERSVYPVDDRLLVWTTAPAVRLSLSWALIAFESLFPLALVDTATLTLALGMALAFHVANACLLGLNRFLWVWLAAYPLLIWFQQRVV